MRNLKAYEYYWRDEIGKLHLIGMLPERRKDPKRINHESVMNLLKKYIGGDADVNEIYFIHITHEP